jgi:hypothetical protein
MSSRFLVVLSGLIFAVLALFGYQLFDWRVDGWILALAGVLHLTVVLKSYPRLDPFLVGIHYLIAVVGLAGVGSVLLEVAGSADRAGGVLAALLQDQWSQPASYVILSVYALLVAALFLVLVEALSWLLHQRCASRRELLVGCFVASLLNIPCDFALTDALSQVAVLNPEESRAFVFAVGLRSLDLPVILHGVIALVVGIAWRGWKAQQPVARADRTHPCQNV